MEACIWDHSIISFILLLWVPATLGREEAFAYVCANVAVDVSVRQSPCTCHSCHTSFPWFLHRHQWYQIQNKVVVDVYAKNMPKERVDVKMEGNARLLISIKADPATAAAEQDSNLPGGVEYQLNLDLYSPVVESGECLQGALCRPVAPHDDRTV